jgi:S-methylmethionine-dependent homocysteine/selenocysteine methylase
MPARWRDEIDAGRPLVIDGGTGSMLQRRGVPVDPICWHATAALTHYSELVAAHAEFIEAGAAVITTNTFATHRYVLEQAGLAADYVALMHATVAAARQARSDAGRSVAIAGSVSCMPPAFDTANYPGEAQLRAAYAEQADTLADLGVDIIALEMIQDPRHGKWALDAAIATGVPVWLGVSCRIAASSGELVCFDRPDVRLAELLDELLAHRPAVVNIMHTPLEAVEPALELLACSWDGPTGVYPEVGSFDAVARTRSVCVSPDEFAAAARRWISRGASVLGGCCGADASHIRALARLVEAAGAAPGRSG